MSAISDLLRVDPGHVDLGRIDPRSTPGIPDKKSVRKDPKQWSLDEFVGLSGRLATYQEQLYALAKEGGDNRRVLLVLQAMDCGGKDGTTKHVVGAMNPSGLRVASFGVPTAEERRHHFLWRIRNALPAYGQVGVFNRSHYEDVLVARVHRLVEPRTWRARYGQINRFEQELAGDGCRLVKVMLHISPDEQLERLGDRLVDPTKHWKYNPGDIDERARWDDYMAAYTDVLRRCSTEHAGWYVVPADRKWYRNWAVAHLLLETFADMGLHYPEVTFDVAAERKRVTALK
ncbi:MAG: PPK2 family polyphosphate kinase [Micromonosporaceae bacterium]